jgi:enoyl-CoA hydratase/carnithine racemase
LSGIRIERQGHLAVLRLDKPRGNAIDEPLVDEITAACADLEADAAVRGVLLASAHPKLFCPGLDLVGLLEYERPAMKRFMGKFGGLVWGLYGLRKPVVAAVGGHAIAGGCILALTADHRVLARGGVQIGLNEVRIGVPLPWSVAVMLRAVVGPAALSRVALLGRNFADDEALDAGLADELADAAGFEDFCLRRLDEFAEKDPVSVATTKAWLRSDVLREMRQHEGRLSRDWLDAWFSEPTRARIRETVAGLGKAKAP